MAGIGWLDVAALADLAGVTVEDEAQRVGLVRVDLPFVDHRTRVITALGDQAYQLTLAGINTTLGEAGSLVAQLETNKKMIEDDTQYLITGESPKEIA